METTKQAALPNAASNVMIVEPDGDLCQVLCSVVEAAGYGAVACTSGNLASKLLRIAPHPFIVLLTDSRPSGNWQQVLSEIERLPPHVYVLLSREPREAPRRWNPHTQAFVPVVPMPFELDELLEQVAAAVTQLPTLSRRYASHRGPRPLPYTPETGTDE